MENQEEVKQAIIERFNNLQPEIKDAIMSSNYEKNLYDIGTKYKLTIEQMGKLEFNTTLVLLGQTHPDDYENDLAADLNLPKETISNIVNDINEKIMKNIREMIKKNFAEDDKEEEALKEVPLPPADKVGDEIRNIKNIDDKAPMPSSNKTEIVNNPEEHHEVYKSAGIEILNDNKTEEIKTDSAIMNSGMNILKDKLDGMTVSKNKVTDYSIPKINNMRDIKDIQKDTKPQTESGTIKKDPYHETIE